MRKLFNFLMRPAVALWGTIGLTALYVLSVGPAFWLWCHVPLPGWAARMLHTFFTPLFWAVQKSDFTRRAYASYVYLWTDPVGKPATEYRPKWPDAPPFITECLAMLMGAWLVWNFVRWVNQRKVAAP